jgi:hypothetical protein
LEVACRRGSFSSLLAGEQPLVLPYARDGIPGSHADQLYLLREHIEFVRENLARE